MSNLLKELEQRELVAIIGDEDTVVGMLLAGIGQRTKTEKNYFIVKPATKESEIENVFVDYTENRKDIGILLINQHVADRIRDRVDNYEATFPALLEIPSKDHPFDPEKDSVLKRINKQTGGTLKQA